MIDASLSQDSTSSEQYKNVAARFTDWLEKSARNVLLMPAILLVLLLSIFPLIVSLYLSFARLSFVRGGFETRFVGLNNFAKLLVGSEQSHFLGRLAPLQPIGWGILIWIVGLLAFALFPRTAAAWRNIFGLVMRIVGVVLGGGLAWWRHFPIPDWAWAGASRDAEPPWQAFLPGNLPAPDDDYTSRYQLSSPNDGRHA
jgi:hypothetical protein